MELVSPHHAARELVHTIRQGHFTSLFQKSVKRVIILQSIVILSMNKYDRLCQESTFVSEGTRTAQTTQKQSTALRDDTGHKTVRSSILQQS